MGKIILTILILSIAVPVKSGTYNKIIIQNNRTKTERMIDRAYAQLQRNRAYADARRDKIMNRAYHNANTNNRRMERTLNRILRNNKSECRIKRYRKKRYTRRWR